MDITKPWLRKKFKVVPIVDAEGNPIVGKMVPITEYWGADGNKKRSKSFIEHSRRERSDAQ